MLLSAWQVEGSGDRGGDRGGHGLGHAKGGVLGVAHVDGVGVGATIVHRGGVIEGDHNLCKQNVKKSGLHRTSEYCRGCMLLLRDVPVFFLLMSN